MDSECDGGSGKHPTQPLQLPRKQHTHPPPLSLVRKTTWILLRRGGDGAQGEKHLQNTFLCTSMCSRIRVILTQSYSSATKTHQFGTRPVSPKYGAQSPTAQSSSFPQIQSHRLECSKFGALDVSPSWNMVALPGDHNSGSGSEFYQSG